MEHIGVNNKKKRRYKTMKLNYEVRDLLDVPQGYYLAHCITAQDRFGGAVARQIDSVFNAYDKIHNLYSELEVGKVAVCDNVFNLVTKESRYDRVTLDTFEKAVEDMANYCFVNLIKKVAMPKIGCGADRLDWETEVLPIIKKAFGSADVEILVCVLSEDEIPEPDFDEDELAYAKSIDALVIEEDDILEENSNGDIKVDNSVFDCFNAGTYIDIYICDREGFITSGYTMLDEDEEGIWFEYVGESRD